MDPIKASTMRQQLTGEIWSEISLPYSQLIWQCSPFLIALFCRPADNSSCPFNPMCTPILKITRTAVTSPLSAHTSWMIWGPIHTIIPIMPVMSCIILLQTSMELESMHCTVRQVRKRCLQCPKDTVNLPQSLTSMKSAAEHNRPSHPVQQQPARTHWRLGPPYVPLHSHQHLPHPWPYHLLPASTTRRVFSTFQRAAFFSLRSAIPRQQWSDLRSIWASCHQNLSTPPTYWRWTSKGGFCNMLVES